MKAFIFVLCVLTLMGSCNYKENVNTQVDNSTYTDSIGKFTIDTLLSMGLSIKASHFRISKLTIRDFKDSKLLLTICASFSKNGLGQLDSLMVLSGNEKQKIVVGRDE